MLQPIKSLGSFSSALTTGVCYGSYPMSVASCRYESYFSRTFLIFFLSCRHWHNNLPEDSSASGYVSLWGSARCTNEIPFSYSKLLLQRYHPEVLEGWWATCGLLINFRTCTHMNWYQLYLLILSCFMLLYCRILSGMQSHDFLRDWLFLVAITPSTALVEGKAIFKEKRTVKSHESQ